MGNLTIFLPLEVKGNFYRQGMALHLVLICPALLAAQDSLGRLVGNKLPLLLQLGDVLEAS